jgi:hypothetical protein
LPTDNANPNGTNANGTADSKPVPMPTVRLTIEVPILLLDHLQKTAAELGLDLSKVVRPALILGLGQIRSLQGVAELITMETNLFMK